MDEIAKQVRDIIVQVFELDVQNLPKELDIDNIANWDSLGHLNLIETLCKKFDIVIDQTQSVELLSEEAIVEFIKQK